RRGVGLSIAALGVVKLGQPADLIAATLRSCAAAGNWKPAITKLAEVTMHAMWMSKLKLAVGASLVLAMLGTGTGWVLMPATAQDKQSPPAPGPVSTTPQPQPPFDETKISEKEAEELLRKAIDALKPLRLAKPKPDADPI